MIILGQVSADHSLVSGLDSACQASLPDEPIVVQDPVLVRLGQFEIEVPQKLWHQFADLQKRDVLAQTRSRTCAKLQ